MKMVKLQNTLNRTYNGVRPLGTINVEQDDVAGYLSNGFSPIRELIKNEKVETQKNEKQSKAEAKAQAKEQQELDAQAKAQQELDAQHKDAQDKAEGGSDLDDAGEKAKAEGGSDLDALNNELMNTQGSSKKTK